MKAKEYVYTAFLAGVFVACIIIVGTHTILDKRKNGRKQSYNKMDTR
jgi:hypothetical protein